MSGYAKMLASAYMRKPPVAVAKLETPSGTTHTLTVSMKATKPSGALGQDALIKWELDSSVISTKVARLILDGCVAHLPLVPGTKDFDAGEES